MKNGKRLLILASILATALLFTACYDDDFDGDSSNLDCDSIEGRYDEPFSDTGCNGDYDYDGRVIVRIYDDCYVTTSNNHGTTTTGYFTRRIDGRYRAEIRSDTCGKGDMSCWYQGGDDITCTYTFDRGGSGTIE
ncbi:MAG: hypothetical protein ABFS19_02540 [Thermodesulfobacteriota bacterium]